jgi:ubiquinone biosynthesis protein UbiJ
VEIHVPLNGGPHNLTPLAVEDHAPTNRRESETRPRVTELEALRAAVDRLTLRIEALEANR